MVTPIDILDTAVKIGLGALITGWTTYWVAKVNHDKMAEKERAKRRRDLLEQITEQVATYDRIVRKHWAFVINWIQFSASEEKMDEATRAELLEIWSEFLDTSKEVIRAQAKLLLLGETRCYEKLDEYVKSVIVFTEDFVSERRVTVTELREYKEELTVNMEAFFNELSKTYSRLSAL